MQFVMTLGKGRFFLKKNQGRPFLHQYVADVAHDIGFAAIKKLLPYKGAGPFLQSTRLAPVVHPKP